ncbi:dUTP pyrophosphatase, partial [Paragonimus westermani]
EPVTTSAVPMLSLVLPILGSGNSSVKRTSILPRRLSRLLRSNSYCVISVMTEASVSGDYIKHATVTGAIDGCSHAIIRFKKLSNDATTPTRGSSLAAGYDLYAAHEAVLPPKDRGFVKTDIQINKGDRIAQLICERIFLPELVECESLSITARGANGYGSTGV